jgi:predicted nucleic acid-binding protein
VIVCDTGVLVAAVDADDRHHAACAAVFAEHGERLVVPASVVVEACWLLNRYVAPEREVELLQAIAARELIVDPLQARDYHRAADLLGTYADLRLGMVDATVVAVAERLGATELATVDRRDFSVVRPAHVDAFTLLP